MKTVSLAAAGLLASGATALAHPGHVAASGGHDHWLAIGAGVAALVILAGAFVAVRRSAKRTN